MDAPAENVTTQAIKTLAQHIQDILSGDSPLGLAGIKKALKLGGVATTGKNKVTDGEITTALNEYVLQGRAFKHASGAKGSDRFWSHDEKDRIRSGVLRLAEIVTPFAKLKAAAKGMFAGTNDTFAEDILRELIGEEKLHEHPPKSATGKTGYGILPPPPPPPPLPWYETKKCKKDADKFFENARKLLDKAGESAESLIEVLRAKLVVAETGESFALEPGRGAVASEPASPPDDELGRRIVEVVSAKKPVAIMEIADLREMMPSHFRGRVFDATVLKLVERAEVRLYQPMIPGQVAIGESERYVRDANGTIFTSIGTER